MEYQICNRCVMDTSDKNIQFDSEGNCNHCNEAIANKSKYWNINNEELLKLFTKIKKEGEGKSYDCLIGISGGIDSSYLAYLCSQHGIRMLGVHIDAGWNTPVSERNIKLLSEKLNMKLETVKINEAEMMDLQRAYFRAEVINQDVPQDHAFFCALYEYAVNKKIKYFLSGGNYASESILPQSWVFNSNDSKNIISIHKKYGKVKLKEYPLMSFRDVYYKYPIKYGLKKLRPLNYIDYDKEKAIEILNKEIGFEYYGAKHCESVFTRLYQGYILPKKFGIDKRRCHLSSLIVAGQLTREEAIKILETPLCSEEQIESDIAFFIQKIGITREEFDANIARKGGRSHYDFKNQKRALQFKNFVKKVIGR